VTDRRPAASRPSRLLPLIEEPQGLTVQAAARLDAALPGQVQHPIIAGPKPWASPVANREKGTGTESLAPWVFSVLWQLFLQIRPVS